MAPSMNPAILIATGGTGFEVLMYLRRLMVQRFGALGNLPILGYLHIDTDHSPESQAMPNTQYLGEDIALVESERLLLTVYGGNSWKDNDAIRDWFPLDLNIPEHFATGCQAQRNYGRLAFSANIDAIRTRVRDHMAQAVMDPATRSAFGEKYGMSVDANLDVFLISSLLGGTGSGMIFDLCYTIRHVLSGFNTTSYGYLITGGPTAQNDQVANCYAALKEMDHYNKHDFVMRYPGAMMPQIESSEGPVQWLYLVNGINAQGVAFPRETVWESVAENIAAEILPGLKERRKTVRDNIRDAGYGEYDKLGKPQCYLAFGMASVEFPALNLQDAFSYRLAAEALGHWSFPQALQENYGRLVDEDIAAWRLTPEHLQESLLQDDAGIPQLQHINAKIAKQQADAAQLLGRSERDDLQLRIETDLGNNDKDVAKRLTLAESGAHIQQLAHRCHRLLLDLIDSRLLPRVHALITNEQSGGVNNAQTYLQTLKQRLWNHAHDHRTRAERYHQEAMQAYNTQHTRLQVFREERQEGMFVVRKHVDALLATSARYQRAQCRSLANTMASELLIGPEAAGNAWEDRSLLGEIETLLQQLNRYETVLRQYRTGCEEQYTRRQASIAGSAGVADVLVSPEEIEQIYQKTVHDPWQMAVALKRTVESALGHNLFTAFMHMPEQVVHALVNAAKEQFVGVRTTSVAMKLSRLSPTERDTKLQSMNKNADVLIQLNMERRQRYCNIAAPEKTQNIFVGTAPPDLEPAMVPGGSLRRDLTRHIPIPAEGFVQTLPERSRLLLAHETGVFSLHTVRDFAGYRTIYMTPQAQTRYRHTHSGINFSDLFPPEESDLQQRAARAVMLGQALGLFAVETDPVSQDTAIYYDYTDRHGRQTAQLGRHWREAEAYLFTQQKDKDILARLDAQTVTLLERLENTLRAKGTQATTRQQKEALWGMLERYLEDRAAALEGGVRHPQYQSERADINAYRDAYDLTRPEEGAAPRSSATRSPQPADLPSDGTEGFRQSVRQLLMAGELSEAQQLQLLARATLDFALDYHQAEALLEEEMARPHPEADAASRPVNPMQIYREAYQRLWEAQQGVLTRRHHAYLQGIRQQLGLTEEQALAMAALVTGGKNSQ